jgi:hypothetical protein
MQQVISPTSKGMLKLMLIEQVAACRAENGLPRLVANVSACRACAGTYARADVMCYSPASNAACAAAPAQTIASAVCRKLVLLWAAATCCWHQTSGCNSLVLLLAGRVPTACFT